MVVFLLVAVVVFVFSVAGAMKHYKTEYANYKNYEANSRRRNKNINGILMVAMACAGSPKDHRCCLVFYIPPFTRLPSAVRVKLLVSRDYNQV